MLCLHCSKATDNPKFCNQSCAASYNNKLFPKQVKKKYYCETCKIEINYRTRFCKIHHPTYVDWSVIKLGDMKSGNLYSRHMQIRELARRDYFRAGNPNYCLNCGYNKHIEVCHIKAIKDFSDDSLVSVVNAATNLVGLCPNCHWELDNNLLKWPH